MNKIQEISVEMIKPDPNQPRKSFDEEEIEEMAKSIKTTGVINPIEVDTKYVIITGERRWRAAKAAGLERMPAKVMKISDEERFMRQVIENIHHDTMTEFDTAVALQKLVDMGFNPPGGLKERGRPETGTTWLSEKIGKSTSWVDEKLALLRTSKQFQAAVKKGDIAATHLRALRAAPEEHKEAIEKKILAGEFRTRDAGLEVVGALNRAPIMAPEILAIDYSKYPTSQEVAKVVSKLAPNRVDKFQEAMKPTEELSDLATAIISWLDTNTPQTVGVFNLHLVVGNLQAVEEEIKKWLKKK